MISTNLICMWCACAVRAYRKPLRGAAPMMLIGVAIVSSICRSSHEWRHLIHYIHANVGRSSTIKYHHLNRDVANIGGRIKTTIQSTISNIVLINAVKFLQISVVAAQREHQFIVWHPYMYRQLKQAFLSRQMLHLDCIMWSEYWSPSESFKVTIYRQVLRVSS